MFTGEKEKNKLWISLCVLLLLCCFCCGTREVAKSYDIIKQNLMEAETIVEEGFLGVENTGKLPCNVLKSCSESLPALNYEKVFRQLPPTSYCVKFDSFATMSKQVNTGKYESRPFSVGGYNWSFVIHPNGNLNDKVPDYIAAYARLHNASLMTNDVYAEIKFFVYCKANDQYYTFQDNEPKLFHRFKPEWGRPNLFKLSAIIAEGAGYVFDGGQSVFCVDIFVTPPFKKWEVFSNEENIRDPIFRMKLTKFSTLDRNSYTSDSFSSGGRNWALKVYPNGVGQATGNSLSLFLLSESNVTGHVQAKLRVLDQVNFKHWEKQVDGWPNATENGWGLDKFLPLADIRNTTKGLLVNDTLKIEVEIVSYSKTDYFSL